MEVVISKELMTFPERRFKQTKAKPVIKSNSGTTVSNNLPAVKSLTSKHPEVEP